MQLSGIKTLSILIALFHVGLFKYNHLTLCTNSDQLTKILTTDEDVDINIGALFEDSRYPLTKRKLVNVKAILWVDGKTRVAVKKFESFEIEELNSELSSMMILNRYSFSPKLLACNKSGSDYYLAMDLVDGKNLKDINLDISKLEGKELLAFWLPAFRGIEIMKREKLVHNDIKGDNMMLTNSSNKLVLIDLDFAASTDDKRVHNFGTPLFMSHDRYAGQPYNNIDDVYSLIITIADSLEPYKDNFDGFFKKNDNGQLKVPMKCFRDRKNKTCREEVNRDLQMLFQRAGLGKYQKDVSDVTEMNLTTLFAKVQYYDKNKMSTFDEFMSVIDRYATEWAIPQAPKETPSAKIFLTGFKKRYSAIANKMEFQQTKITVEKNPALIASNPFTAVQKTVSKANDVKTDQTRSKIPDFFDENGNKVPMKVLNIKFPPKNDLNLGGIQQIRYPDPIDQGKFRSQDYERIIEEIKERMIQESEQRRIIADTKLANNHVKIAPLMNDFSKGNVHDLNPDRYIDGIDINKRVYLPENVGMGNNKKFADLPTDRFSNHLSKRYEKQFI